MSGISKRVSGSWVSGDYGIMGTSTDTITTLPADLYPNDTTATVGISGNTVQNGTPTPSNPVDVNGVGERTENLFNIANVRSGDLTVTGTTITKGSTAYNIDLFSGVSGASAAIPTNSLVLEAGTYTLSCDVVTGVVNMFLIVVCPYTSTTLEPVDKYFDGRNGKSFTLAEKSYVSLRIQQKSAAEVKDIMIISGSQSPTSYIPYGYKIPISSANTTTPIYLGEVQTTRKIRELVLTGEENWFVNETVSTEDTLYLYTTTISSNTYVPEYSICSHFEYKDAYSIRNGNGYHLLSGYGGLRFRVMRTIADTVTDFKSYLAAQYANGTPVTVWYILAEPQTTVVNEPIRKIGDYADTVSGITIPTIAGADSFDVLTTLKPSEVTANYHGWHTGAVHERDSGQWD